MSRLGWASRGKSERAVLVISKYDTTAGGNINLICFRPRKNPFVRCLVSNLPFFDGGVWGSVKKTRRSSQALHSRMAEENDKNK